MIERANITDWLPPPIGYGRERVAAIIEAATGRSPLAPCHGVLREQRIRLVAEAKAALGQQANASLPPPDGLRTAAEAARKLRCSTKTLKGHLASGALRYVIVGHGTKRPRRMFTPADLDSFIANQTRKDVPCPSSPSRARHTSTSTSASEVIAFTAQPRPRPSAKPKK